MLGNTKNVSQMSLVYFDIQEVSLHELIHKEIDQENQE